MTQKRYYALLNSPIIPWTKLRLRSIDTMGDNILTQCRLLLAADDSAYGKSTKKIEYTASHFDHSAKVNAT